LPLSSSLITICKLYKTGYLLTGKFNSDYFSVQTNDKKCSSDTVYRWFRKILWEANISHGGKGLGPRVHDFRHSFSVHSLAEMSRKDMDLYYCLDRKSTRLNSSHVSISYAVFCLKK